MPSCAPNTVKHEHGVNDTLRPTVEKPAPSSNNPGRAPRGTQLQGNQCMFRILKLEGIPQARKPHPHHVYSRQTHTVMLNNDPTPPVAWGDHGD